MSQELLKALYDERIKIVDRLKTIDQLIISYGGDLPDNDEAPAFIFKGVEAYPHAGTWKDKILYVLKGLSEPLPAGEIAKLISKYEDVDLQKLTNTVTQYCSSMFIHGEIGADKGYRNKYFLKS